MCGGCTDAERTGAVREGETNRDHGFIYSRAQNLVRLEGEIGNLGRREGFTRV